MSLISSGFPNIPNSITNPLVDIKNALDTQNPFSLLDFIKSIDSSYDANTIQNYYGVYIKEWNKLKTDNQMETNDIIISRYRDFVRDIGINYTTIEEKKFLSKIDFNDPLDLEVAIPFFSRKLIDVAEYYNNKREEAKFQVTKKQTSNTNFNIPKEIVSLTLNYLEKIEDGKIIFNIDDIKNNIEVEIEELYDTYPYYYNQTPNEKVFDAKDLDFGLDIFLKSNQELVNEVFSGFSQELINLKEGNELFETKRNLTRKYIASDFYFLSTGNTVFDFVSGQLFSADDPSSNFLNRNYPTSVSTDRKQLLTPREKGFFRPHKTSIVLLDGENYRYSFNFSNLKPNSIYYFPDPLIYGDNGDILLFESDDSNLKRNETSGKSKNQPTSKKTDSKYYGYVSQIDITPSKYLDQIFESGYIQDSKSDTYGNLFGLFKDNGKNFRKNIKNVIKGESKNLIINGHTFYDYLYGEGFNFDYSVFDDTTYPDTTRSGLSTYTGNFATPLVFYYNIFGGTFKNDTFYIPDNKIYQIIDGYYITDGVYPLFDDISSDLSAYPANGNFYYTRLIEGGIHDSNPLQRALLDPLYPSLTADLTQNIFPDGVNTFFIDGEKLSSEFNFVLLPPSSRYFELSVLEPTKYILSSYETDNYFDRYKEIGTIYVKNSFNREVKRIDEALSYLETINNSAFNEVLSAVNKFEIVKDVIFIETSNYFIISKMSFENGDFIDPKTQIFVLDFNDNPFNKISQRYKKGESVIFSIINTTQYPLTSNLFKIKPNIYEFDTNNFKLLTFAPDTNDALLTVDGGSITYIKADSPTLTYNSRINNYTLSFLLKNVNNNFSLEEFDFFLNPFNLTKHNRYIQL